MIALAERGALFDPGPCMYMEKMAVGPAVDPTAVSLNMSIKENLEVVAKSLSKPIGYVSAVSPQTLLSRSCIIYCLLKRLGTPCSSIARSTQPASAYTGLNVFVGVKRAACCCICWS